jgi:hypothetical protein
MERYSFLNYVKLKEKKFNKYKEFLEHQLGAGSTNKIDISKIQMELLKIKRKLKDIQDMKTNNVIDPYDKLKGLIESINLKISNIDSQVNTVSSDNNIKENDLINKINELDILLDSTRADYVSVNVDRKLKFMKEKIEPEAITKIYDKYISDTNSMVNDLKLQLGKGESLVNNTEILANIKKIEDKINEYKIATAPIDKLEISIEQYITEMESLFKFQIDKTFTPEKITKDTYDKEKIEAVTEDNVKFSYFDPELPTDKDDKELIDTKFLNNPNPEKIIGNKIQVQPTVIEQPEARRPRSSSTSSVSSNFSDDDNASVSSNISEKSSVRDKIVYFNKPKQKYNAKYQIAPQDFSLLMKRQELNLTMNELYKNWVDKLKKIKLENTQILKYKLIESKNKINISIIDRLKEDLNKTLIYITDTELKTLVDLTLTEIIKTKNELIEKNKNCISLIDDFESNKKINEDLSKKCNLININNEEYKTVYSQVVIYITKQKEEIKSEITKIKKDIIIIKNAPSLENIKNQLIDIIKMKIITSNNDVIIAKKNIIKLIQTNIILLNNLMNTTDETNLESKNIKEFILNKLDKNENFKELLKKGTLAESIVNNGYNTKTLISTLEENVYKLTEKEDILNILIKNLNSFNKEVSQVDGKIKENTILRGGAELNQFIDKLNDFEKVIREMKIKRKIIVKQIKKYNVRYTQFFNFQKYIVNYVSLTLAQKDYDYYKYLSKGTISFYDSILNKMEQTIDKYENPKFFTDDSLKDDQNKWLYGKHYFIIKILRSFFKQLYQFWDDQYKLNPNLWVLQNKINTQSENDNKKYFFLFNLFVRILDAYHMKLPPVANYMRINAIDGIPKKFDTFTKGSKHTLDINKVKTCGNLENDPLKEAKANAINKVNFEEIFDPDNFKENENLSLYMGLGNMLSEGKSIMLLTYGYSGVGKTFTLFGAKSTNVNTPAVPGLLQTTLNNLTNFDRIELKAFELYGLGVPYKFYWESNKFEHFIYNYKLIDKTNVSDPSPTETINNGFEKLLDKNQNYQEIDKEQIDNFSIITSKIDDIRKSHGRIKKTINNPESSRSIMIYDFKITFKDGKQCRFVVMDLPGKENLYQTYCADDKDTMYKPKQEYTKFRTGPGGIKSGGSYDLKMIKSMMFINPLWMSLVPEIAEHFDKEVTHLDYLRGSYEDVKTVGIYRCEKGTTFDNMEKYIGHSPANSSGKYSYLTYVSSNAHRQVQFVSDVPNSFDKPQFAVSKQQQINLGLYGMWERAFSNILNVIKDKQGNSNLIGLGEKINNMLEDKESRDKKYGYAGLEGIYINENILGLLEVLSEKIQKNRNPNLTPDKVKHVVCQQKEIYKTLFPSSKTPIDYNILASEGKVNNDGSFKEKSTIFVEDDEFYSQIKFLKTIAKLSATPNGNSLNFASNSFFRATENDMYNTKIRNMEEYTTDTKTKGIKKDIEDNNKSWINNYDYNKIFNIENPAIKSILKEYLNDDSFRNFYLFFVVSNNQKGKKGDATGLETCDKQIQLLYDTRDFMDIIANENAEGVKCE